MRVLRITGIAVAAMLTLSAMVASGASGAQYKSETTTTYGTAVNEGNTVFQAGAKVTCTGTTGNGEFTSPATTLTSTNVAQTGCTVAGQAATVNMNGCDYKFGEPTGAGSPYTINTVKIECPAGNEIVITATTAGCTIKVGSQTPSSTSTVTNNTGPPKTVTATAKVSKIAYTGSGGICGGPGAAATYEGKFKVTGYSDAAHTKPTGVFIG